MKIKKHWVLDHNRTGCEYARRTGSSLADGALFREPRWGERGASNQ